MDFRLSLVVASSVFVSFACQPQPQRRIEFFKAPPTGDVASLVKSELDLGIAEHRRILVYVGATWCEPCKRFHQAVEEGKLDGRFRNLRLFEFDQDRDAERLRAAGYVSRLIPLFALPSSDGRSSQIQVEGSIKGNGAVDEIVPRLNSLLTSK